MVNKLAGSYRRDIDGIRAIAVMAVILFHMGYLPNGYLGVDVFFVISGYLITKIAFKEVVENRFSIIQFYLRRIRRIIPLVLFTTSIALIIGLFVMLPDDLENLSESVVATNLFFNNILQLITTRNYWDIVNEYKPLMHTWSLGVEEQFYLIFPLIFFFFKKEKIKWILPILLFFSAVSLFLYFSSSYEPSRFYSIQFRFFELSLGGIGAIIIKDKIVNDVYKAILMIVLLLILLFNIDLPDSVKLFSTVLATLGVLISDNNKNKLCSFILENKLMVGLGKISFSLYMWHQIVLAFTRYSILETFSFIESLFVFIFIFLLSVTSYYLIEQPFRDKNKIKNNVLLWITGTVFVLSTSASLYTYFKAGVIRDVPELEIYKSNIERNMHSKYNSRIYDLDRNFVNSNKIKILIIGDSFARDWANILLESKYSNIIEISYIYDINNSKNLIERFSKAKYVFFSEIERSKFNVIAKKFKIDSSKVWNVGTKNFGMNNGIFYNRRRNQDYFNQRINMETGFLKLNNLLKKEWGDKYIDLIGMIIDERGTIPVFTPDRKYISQDCRHLTHSGAMYFGKLLNGSRNLKIE